MRRAEVTHIRGCAADGAVYLEGVDWQQITALGIVALTGVLMLWHRFRSRRSGGGKPASCSGCAHSHAGPQPTVVYRARKGERPEITIRPG